MFNVQHVAVATDDDTIDFFLNRLNNFTQTNMKYNTTVKAFAPGWLALKYDSVYLYGVAVDECLNFQNTSFCDWKSGRDIQDRIRLKRFEGLLLFLELNGLNDRLFEFFVSIDYLLIRH